MVESYWDTVGVGFGSCKSKKYVSVKVFVSHKRGQDYILIVCDVTYKYCHLYTIHYYTLLFWSFSYKETLQLLNRVLLVKIRVPFPRFARIKKRPRLAAVLAKVPLYTRYSNRKLYSLSENVQERFCALIENHEVLYCSAEFTECNKRVILEIKALTKYALYLKNK